MSALCPQNMLEQLLIHQPEDPIPFMIDHLQRDNDYGGAPGVASPLPRSQLSLPLCLLGTTLPFLCLQGRSEQGWGQVLTTWEVVNWKMRSFLLEHNSYKCSCQVIKMETPNGPRNQLLMLWHAPADVACWV